MRSRIRVRAQIDRTADDVAQPLNAALLSGHPARAIAQEAERRQADLVVLGIGKYAPADGVFGVVLDDGEDFGA